MEITIDDIKRMSPMPNLEAATDEYYLTVARYVDKLWGSMRVFPELSDEERRQAVLSLTAYFQDVVADAGVWRSFIGMCRHLYARPVPFYDEPENYVDSELNQIDVQFVLWYALESALGFMGLVSPFDKDLLRFAAQVYRLFDFLYEDAPAADDFSLLKELDLSDHEQAMEIFKASGWLFWNSYLMRPISKYAYERGVSTERELSVEETLTDERRLRITLEQPTGPLALLADEWLHLAVDNRFPTAKKQRQAGEEHQYFKELTAATGGDVIAFIPTYEDLEVFLSDKMGWGENPGGHLPQMKGRNDFVLFADPRKGLIVSPGIARFVKHPLNGCYDQTLASEEAFKLIMERGFCPVDLARFLFEEGLVPDAEYPTGSVKGLLRDNWDFLARMYLKDYYRNG